MQLSLLLVLLPLYIRASPLFEATPQTPFVAEEHTVDPEILRALETYDDPVDALLAARPALASQMAESRLLEVDGAAAVWMTEGDKLRLRKDGKGFVDFTEYQKLLRSLFKYVSTEKMGAAVEKMTSYFNRHYKSVWGVQSSHWLHTQLNEIINGKPWVPISLVSLSYHPHAFPQNTIIAGFEPEVLNASAPLTIIGAHQDSINQDSPVMPAPGAVDDASGSISILEAFRVLHSMSYVPARGPVEFHWYAAEEAGLLGSLDRAKYTYDLGRNVGAMIQMDMTAFVPSKVEEHIGIVRTENDPELVDWVVDLAEAYLEIPVRVHEVGGPGISDHVSWHKYGYPTVCVDESDARYSGGYPYIHTVKDRMDIDDSTGRFSIDHMARFTELALAFVVEQAGWATPNKGGQGTYLWD